MKMENFKKKKPKRCYHFWLDELQIIVDAKDKKSATAKIRNALGEIVTENLMFDFSQENF